MNRLRASLAGLALIVASLASAQSASAARAHCGVRFANGQPPPVACHTTTVAPLRGYRVGFRPGGWQAR